MSFYDFILSTSPNPQRYGKRRRTQLRNLRSNSVMSNINKPNLDKRKKVVSVNKLYPNLKPNKDLEIKDDIVKLGSDRKYDDIVKYYYNRKERHFVPTSTQKSTLLSFNEWLIV